MILRSSFYLMLFAGLLVLLGIADSAASPRPGEVTKADSLTASSSRTIAWERHGIDRRLLAR